MNRLSAERRARIIAALCDGASIRATCRMTGTAKGTVLKLLAELGEVCLDYQRRNMAGLQCRRIQCDEIWAFVGAKEKHVTEADKANGMGDVWTWTAICADTKLVPCWHVGARDAEAARLFIEDLASRLAHRVQLSTDGHKAYLTAVEGTFGWNGVDFATLVKLYSNTARSGYSPPEMTGTEKRVIMGNPDERHISTSFVERQNLTMRMQMRRFTRLTNGFSKKLANHLHAVSLHFMYYNYCRPHATLTKAAGGIHTTPAMAAKITDRVWTVLDLASMIP
jgi:IS1 family transposase